jgi:hypothetical protein
MVPTNYLNEYHLQFLKLFIDRGCRFLIIGGQARAVHDDARTRDLDVWVDISHANRPTAEQCISAWTVRYPLHAILQKPVSLQAGQQIKFPDADVMFLGPGDRATDIAPADGIDLLTSVGQNRFEDYYDRAYWEVVAGMRLPFLSQNDLDVISPTQTKT